MVKMISIQGGGVSTDALERLIGIMKRKIVERCEVVFKDVETSDLAISLGLDLTLGEDGFKIQDGSEGEIQICGQSICGILAGIGKFLRSAEYTRGNGGGFTPGAWRGASVPHKKVRGIYFASHFRNFYHRAPLDQIERYIEDLGLWGYNAVTVWFDMHHYRSIEEPEALEMIGRLHTILSAAEKIGLQTGLLVLGNEAYDESPLELRADWTTGHDGYFGDFPSYHLELCPSNADGFELLLKWRREVFDAFADLRLDYVWIWPYDQGGCSCRACVPWGGNGYLKIARPVAEMARQFFPSTKIILSTWYFECFIHGEWEAFASQINRDPAWVDYLLAEFPGKFPEYILQNGVPGGLPLLGFPEISMFESEPWGGYGANPLPGYIQNMWAEVGDRLSGGFPYSEGIFEDINKAVVAMFYWQGSGNPEDAIREYAAFEFSGQMKEEIAQAVLILESTNRRERLLNGQPEWMPTHHDPEGDEQFVIFQPSGIDKAYEILHRVDRGLDPVRRNSWRWRILFLRSVIDYELAQNDFRINERIEEAFEELIRIYHAEDSLWAVRPPARRGRMLGWK